MLRISCADNLCVTSGRDIDVMLCRGDTPKPSRLVGDTPECRSCEGFMVLLRTGDSSSRCCEPAARARGSADPMVMLRTLPVGSMASSSTAPSLEAALAASLLGLRLTSSCRALILCQVFNLRPTEPRSNSFRNILFWSMANKTSPLISCSLNTVQWTCSTPVSSRYSATRAGFHAMTSSSVYVCWSSSSVSWPGM